MPATHPVVVSDRDFARLSALMRKVDPKTVELLEDELARAAIVPADELPADVVAMGSTVLFTDLSSEAESTVTLVYPDQASAGQGRVSILAPVGAALIGLRVGQTIEWPMPKGGSRKMKVVAVTHEAPAAAPSKG